MLSLRNFPPVDITKNLVGDQNYDHCIPALTATAAFDVTEGWGSVTADSKILALLAGGFDDQEVTGQFKFVSPTAAGAEAIGVFVRGTHLTTNLNRKLYWARLINGFARISKQLGNGVSDTPTNMVASAFAVAQGQLVTVRFEVRRRANDHQALFARFEADGGSPAPVEISVTDSSSPIASGGLMGFRTLSVAGYCRSLRGRAI
jgi:hypothetical protein